MLTSYLAWPVYCYLKPFFVVSSCHATVWVAMFVPEWYSSPWSRSGRESVVALVDYSRRVLQFCPNSQY